MSDNAIGVILSINGDLARAEPQFEAAIAMSDGRLYEAKSSLEFCRAKRIGKHELVARAFRVANRACSLGVV